MTRPKNHVPAYGKPGKRRVAGQVRRIAEMRAGGASVNEIAVAVSRHPATVQRTLSSAEGRALLEEATGRLISAAPGAASTLVELSASAVREADRIKAASKILDAIGIGGQPSLPGAPVLQQFFLGPTAVLSPDVAAAMAGFLGRSMAVDGELPAEIIDVPSMGHKIDP